MSVKDTIRAAVRRVTKLRRAEQIVHLPGPTSAGGASMNVFWYEDGGVETVEYSWQGAEVARYEGEPRDVPEGAKMPEAPPRPPWAAPLVTGPPPPNAGAR